MVSAIAAAVPAILGVVSTESALQLEINKAKSRIRIPKDSLFFIKSLSLWFKKTKVLNVNPSHFTPDSSIATGIQHENFS